MRTLALLALSSALVLGIACTKKSDAPNAAAPGAPAAAATGNLMSSDTSAKADIELTIGSDGDNIAFDKTTLEVKAGSMVKLTFKSNVKTSGMEHNWVLTQAGKESEIANSSISAGQEKGWLNADAPGVLAYTKLIKAGESDTILFKAPPAGDYPYICTFPGHAIAMKGTLKSK